MDKHEKYLKLLRLGPGATEADIKKAYRKLAKENHPDRFTGEDKKKKQEAIMARVNEAYRKALDCLKGVKDAVKEEAPAPDGGNNAETDYQVYKKAVAYFNKYNGSISLKFKNNRMDTSSIKERKADLEESRALFQRLLREFPDSDWCYDAGERLERIAKILPMLEKNIGNAESSTLAYTKKGTPFWKKIDDGNPTKGPGNG